MKKLLTGLIVALNFAAFSQLPYTWTAGVNPGWVGAGALQWQAGCNYVTTNCAGNYSNNMNTTYTSPTIDASCSNASTVSITFMAFGNAEFSFDFMFLEYSLNNGTTWINPYGVGTGWTGNFGVAPGTTIPPFTAPTSPNFRFRFNFQSDVSVNSTGYKLTDFDIACNVVLPVEMVSFAAKRVGSENKLEWSTLSEKDNDYFDVEWSVNPEAELWTSISRVYSLGNSEVRQNYQINHSDPTNGKKNYYRITQVDTDGTRRTYENLVVVDNTMKDSPLKEIINLMGQAVDENTPGFVIYVYEDGTKLSKYQ
ncbi:hypothetical protein [Fluviicola taffensis]|uniref:Uncharacterized protein n=1 Tax=Fluviicola taffensis (strain DSM 16823 / NCIMB 13979 / RW262) TaxID=755732 RepID=F2IC71_FLUTR|nr:hypothetical protein [Fluviicola taffensis]AEA43297.1 hypothetical protein Fluta_1302 [Fluviicola taffensis DSM 16823]